MFKTVLVLSCLFFLSAFTEIEARPTKHKKKDQHSRIKKRKRRAKNGPDLKAITQGTVYTENPNNGITPIETTGNAN